MIKKFDSTNLADFYSYSSQKLSFSSSIWAPTFLVERKRERVQKQRGSKRSKKKSKERKEGISPR
jgi:hypothetical protein